MMIFDKARENAEAVRRVGLLAIEEAQKLGVPVHYMDPSLGDGIIREMPDGTRHRLKRIDGVEVVVETYPRPVFDPRSVLTVSKGDLCPGRPHRQW